ncbi:MULTISPECIES: M15 family metallopeptidase [unclassified Rhodococcus (in: high G+C Gram-positive bacteria)]|uniref:M15 family metallopeptidase n=1 Tax=unclassified Rhodococcus (in: high G+C Gram-positive bacteria) TaxID=192944 RepID=UPI000929A247|nr:M15 family metallopeptidase [Rhodococcus sp. M8]OLL21260.1 endolysin [Rhodococcus sp. M8]
MSFRTAYGYTHSENGWRMCNRDECVVANVAPFTNTAPIRAGDAATILNAWILWYHQNVEPLISPVWGWSAQNDVPNSNHLSGTAIDLNAVKYPWGRRVMPQEQIEKIRRGLQLFEGTVFWGADWQRADEMHYQIGLPEGDPRVALFAQKLNAGYLGIYGPEPVKVQPAAPVDDSSIWGDIWTQLTGGTK